jgi:organic hydroperoxide reductase OsmC/OhrA
MMGTLAGRLAKSKIRTLQDRFTANATGDVEDVDGVLKITRIRVHYSLKLPPEKRPDAEAALDDYIHRCPSAQSVIDAIEITHSLEMEDLPI